MDHLRENLSYNSTSSQSIAPETNGMQQTRLPALQLAIQVLASIWLPQLLFPCEWAWRVPLAAVHA